MFGLSKFYHRASALTLHVKALTNSQYDVTFRRAGKVLGTLNNVGNPACRTHDNAHIDDDRLAALAALSFVQSGPCASSAERAEDPSLQAWQDLSDEIGFIHGDRTEHNGEEIFWLRRIG